MAAIAANLGSSMMPPRARKIIWHATYLLVPFALMACERRPESLPRAGSPGGLWIAAISPSENAPNWPGIAGGVSRYLAEAPTVDGECVARRADEAPRALVQRVLERHPAAIVVYVPSPAEIEPFAAPLLEANVTLVTVGGVLPGAAERGHVGIRWSEAAEALGAALPQVAGDGLSYVLVRGPDPQDGDERRYDRFTTAARRMSSPRLLAEGQGTGVRETAAVVARLFAEYPRTGLVVTLEPDIWLEPPLGWIREMRALNRDFRYATLSAAPTLWAGLGTPSAPGGAAALVGPLDGECGYEAAELAVSLVLNAETPPRRHVGCEIVTAATLPEFARRYSAAAGGLDVTAWLPEALRPPSATAPARTQPARRPR